MERNFPPLPVRILVLLIILGTVGYFVYRSFNTTDKGQQDASGTIESVTVNVSPEMAGKVKEVFVAEGQSVKMGDPLLSLDDSLIQSKNRQPRPRSILPTPLSKLLRLPWSPPSCNITRLFPMRLNRKNPPVS